MQIAFEAETRAGLNGATIVFDLDGTLVDTAPDLIGATHYVLALHGLPGVPPDKIRPWISFGARRMITEAFILADKPLTDAQTDPLQDAFLDHYVANIARHSRLFPGIEAVLPALADAGARLAVCTNKRAHLSDMLLKALGVHHHFDAVAGRDTFPVHKPDPQHLLATVDMAGGNPARAIMIGDSATDIKTARAAEVPVIGVTFGYTDTPMADLCPNVLIDTYEQLPCALDALTA